MIKLAPLFMVTIAVLVLASCNNQGDNSQQSATTLSPEVIAHKVGNKFGDGNPKVLKAEKTKSDSNGAPMYLMIIKGTFTKGNKNATYLRFSSLANKFYYWALEASKDKSFNKIVWSKE